jgi:glycosyltransferase involved in cell wall biosynthesis
VPVPRHVGFNALFLDPSSSGGVDTYLRGLVPALVREFPQLEPTIFTTRRGARALRDDGWSDFARIVRFPFDEGQRERRLLAEQLGIVGGALRRRVDVLHSLASTGPAWPVVPSVVTVHDVTFFRMQTFGRLTTAAMRAVVTGAARSADALIAVSAAARDEIAEQLRIPPDRFLVVPHGAGRLPAAEATAPALMRERLGLDGRRLALCVAAVRPHKNQGLLVEALPQLPDDVAVVLVGTHEAGAGALRPRAEALGVGDRLHMPGYLPDPDVESLWRMADCAVFPTRAEGFGLPVLEAMGRGVPVACSDIPVLHEVGADAAHYFPPDDAAAAAAAIVRAMADGGAAARGRARAGTFSWEAAAHGTYAAYERALS